MGPNSPKLLIREIMFWVGAVNALVALLVSMKWLDWSPEQTSGVLAAINAVFAVIGALATRPFPVPLLTGAMTAILTMGAGFGLHITDEQVGMWNALLVTVFGALASLRTSPEPAIDPLAKSQNVMSRRAA